MQLTTERNRLVFVALALCTIAVGLIVRWGGVSLPVTLRDPLGDALWAMMIGAGGMATVYLAEDLKHNRKVAVKVLKPELAVAIGAERFLAEIKTTANLQHPHILALHDSGEVNGTVFYVMPYVEGESLRDRLDRENQLPIRTLMS